MSPELACSFAELEYLEMFKKEFGIVDEEELLREAFPDGWYSRTDYEEKIELLTEATSLHKNLNAVVYEKECQGIVK